MSTSADLRYGQAGQIAGARAAYAESDWATAYAGFSAAGALGPLSTDDLEAMAAAAWRLGRLAESVRLSELVFTQQARRDPVLAGDTAVVLALAWLTRGDRNVARSWMERARRLISGAAAAPTHAHLAYLEVSTAGAEDLDARVSALAALRDELASPAVDALTLVAQARQALQQDRMEDAFERLDAALRAVPAARVAVEWAGEIYGSVLRFTRGDADLGRSMGWTDVVERWLEQTALAGVYRGWAAHARGAVQVRAGDYRRGLDTLAVALREYRQLQPQRDTADVYRWMMVAHRNLGEGEAAAVDAATAADILRLLDE